MEFCQTFQIIAIHRCVICNWGYTEVERLIDLGTQDTMDKMGAALVVFVEFLAIRMAG